MLYNVDDVATAANVIAVVVAAAVAVPADTAAVTLLLLLILLLLWLLILQLQNASFLAHPHPTSVHPSVPFSNSAPEFQPEQAPQSNDYVMGFTRG